MRCTKCHPHTHIAVLDDIIQWVGESKSTQADTISVIPIFIPDTHTYKKDSIKRDPTSSRQHLGLD